jgi:hypothetical protein
MSSTIETITTTTEEINTSTPEAFCIHSELKKLTPLERVQLLNKIIKEEAQAQEQAQAQAQEQEQNQVKEQEQKNNINKEECCTIQNCEYQMKRNSQAIFEELRSLRMQIQSVKYELQYLHQKQSTLQTKNIEEYEKEESCSIISLFFDWIPIWFIFVLVIFAITGGKSRVCSLSSSCSTGLGTGTIKCPISGLSEMFTSL